MVVVFPFFGGVVVLRSGGVVGDMLYGGGRCCFGGAIGFLFVCVGGLVAVWF